eukprot:TRINITY_DN22873_c0_g1_i1.p3 TRINITY_DN22873_c0_g1~~TRINITY_DN22873_c0_g1_i1.p3  ORF type:complete len:121 (-),score=16.54 TRINITY_DN22873_c0_g1_i1:502-864(-)
MTSHEQMGAVYNTPEPNSHSYTPTPTTNNNNQTEQDQAEVDVRSQLRKKMFVGGLSNDIKEDHMKRYFSKFGQVVKAEVIKSGEGKSRGFGFVTFSDIKINTIFQFEINMINIIKSARNQ